MTDRELMRITLDLLEKLNKDGWILADFEDEVYASIEALRARLAQPEHKPADVFLFLLGERELDGAKFGERHPTERGNYWWRKHLRAVLAQPEPEPVDKAGSPCKEFWDWLPKAYRDGDKGEDAKFTKYNMEVAYLAGKQSQPKQEPVATLFGSLPVYDVPPPEQEPVAWMVITMGEVTSMQPHMIAAEMLDGTHQLYTAPTREWQGLTDEEMFSLWVKCPAETEDRFAFARAIEQVLKEKNNG